MGSGGVGGTDAKPQARGAKMQPVPHPAHRLFSVATWNPSMNLRAPRHRLSLSAVTWVSWVTSALFGSVPVFNVLVTGQLLESAVQALAAFLSGLLFMALLLRTGSLWVPMACHALWDFGTFRVSSGASRTAAQPTDFSQGWAWALPALLVLPNALYGLYLLRQTTQKPE